MYWNEMWNVLKCMIDILKCTSNNVLKANEIPRNGTTLRICCATCCTLIKEIKFYDSIESGFENILLMKRISEAH